MTGTDLSDDLRSCFQELDNLHTYISSSGSVDLAADADADAAPHPPHLISTQPTQQPAHVAAQSLSARRGSGGSGGSGAAEADADVHHVLPQISRIMHVVQQGLSAGCERSRS